MCVFVYLCFNLFFVFFWKFFKYLHLLLCYFFSVYFLFVFCFINALKAYTWELLLLYNCECIWFYMCLYLFMYSHCVNLNIVSMYLDEKVCLSRWGLMMLIMYFFVWERTFSFLFEWVYLSEKLSEMVCLCLYAS